MPERDHVFEFVLKYVSEGATEEEAWENLKANDLAGANIDEYEECTDLGPASR